MKGRAKKVESGQQPSRAHSPFGYHIVTHADVTRGSFPVDMLGKYVLVPDKADAAMFVYETYASGRESLSSICRLLFLRGASPRRAKYWCCASLTDILTNPVYKGQPASGRYRYQTDESRVSQIGRADRPIKTARVLIKKSPEDWVTLSAPAIVSAETWDVVQRRFADSRANSAGNPRHTYLLSGMVMCPTCESPMMLKGRTRKDVVRRVYICSHYHKSQLWTGEQRCEKITTPVPIVENAVIRAICNAVQEPDAMRVAEAIYLTAIETDKGNDPRKQIIAVDRALEQLNLEEHATVHAQVAGIRAGASADAYATAFADIALRRKNLESERGSLVNRLRSTTKDRKSSGHLRSLVLIDVHTAISSQQLSNREKRELVRTVVDKVVCRPGWSRCPFLL